MLGVLRGVSQQPLRGVLALHQQSGERSDELMLQGQRHDPLGYLPLLGSCWSQRPAGEPHCSGQILAATQTQHVKLLEAM